MVNLTPYVTDEEVKAVAALSDDARAVLKAQINSTNPFTIFEPVEGKEKQIICPKCGSGTHGNHNSGITPKNYNGVWLYHCFAGNDFEGDLIKIIANENNLSTKGKDFFQVLTIAAKVAGINIYSPADETQFRKSARKNQTTKKEKTAKELAQERAAAEYIELSRPNLKDFIARCKNGKWRGLGYDVLNFLRWGFCAKYKHTENNFVFPAMIIPNDKGGILARRVDGDEKSNLSPTGTTTIYLPEADSVDVVVPEGAINGASILQAIPAPPFGIIASGGTSGKKNVVAKVQELIQQGKKIRAILAFDNDSNNAGQNAAVKLRDELLKISIPAVIVDITKQADVDLNDVLQQENGEIKLAQMVTDAVSLAQVELDKVAAEMEKKSALKEKITDWTKRNGEIENLDEVKAAADYLQSFTVDKITSTVATESKTIQALAKCKYYDFYQQVADDFLARVLSAKDAAKQKVKTSTAENPVSDSARMTAGIEKKEIDDAVKKAVTAVAKKHLKYQQAQEQRRQQEEYQQRKEETQIKNQDLFERLKELQKECSSPARNAEMQEIILELCEWNYNKRGEKISVKSSMANYDLIFTYDPFVKELFGYEEFSQSDVLLKTPLWNKCNKFEKWTDLDDSNLRVYLRRTYKDICGEQLYYDVFKAYSVQNAFNVVKNYFKNLPNWDGTERAENLFSKFLGVADNEFTRAVTIKWLLAAVARIFYPGCNFQAALVLQGNQNIGKSYILERLGGAWYGALIDNVEDLHAVDAIKNLWIVELKEMAAARKSEINAVKSFIERSADNHRAAYEKRVQTFKRHCVFAISVNDKQFLRDLTGNRRYWILESPLAEFKYINGLTPEYIQQIWAEVFYKFKELTKDGFNDKILELPLELKIQAENIADKFTADDGLQKEIPAFLDIQILPPILWKLLTKEERRDYFKHNYIELENSVWLIKREMLKSDKDKKEFDNAIDEKNNFVRYNEKKFGENHTLLIAVHGSYTRQKTCAVEIYNEFYSGSDKRKQIFRINDVLANLENWELSDKQNKDFNGYGHQRKSYCRITNAEEVTADDSATLAQDSNYYLDEVDVPF